MSHFILNNNLSREKDLYFDIQKQITILILSFNQCKCNKMNFSNNVTNDLDST